MSKLTSAVLVAALLLCMTILARAQQDAGKLPFENEQLRVVEYVIPAGGRLGLESHAPHLLFCVDPFVAKLRLRNGEIVSASFTADDARWYDSSIIRVANLGDSEGRFLIIEIKKPAPTSKGDAPADDGTKVAPDVYKLIFENERVRVIRVGVKPGGQTPMHSHPGSAFRYSMTDTKAKLTMPDGTTREVENKAGFARWTELATRHAHESLSAIPGRTILIEIK